MEPRILGSVFGRADVTAARRRQARRVSTGVPGALDRQFSVRADCAQRGEAARDPQHLVVEHARPDALHRLGSTFALGHLHESARGPSLLGDAGILESLGVHARYVDCGKIERTLGLVQAHGFLTLSQISSHQVDAKMLPVALGHARARLMSR